MDFGKRKQSDSDDAVSKKRSCVVFVNDPPTYSSSEGLKSSVHGTVYQLNLSVLFLQRGLNNKYLFRLAVEMDAAEKFDDLVFQYVKKDAAGRDLIAQDGEPVYVYRFLQAKHKQDEGKTITYHDLCTADKKGEFSLPKYFTSYRTIKQKAEFQRGEIRDYILCTNISLDFAQLTEKKIEIEEITEPDDFLTMRVTNYSGKKKSARCYKLRPVNSAAHELYDILKNTSDLHRLAKELVKHIKLKKPADLTNASFKSYHAALVQESVMQIEKKLDGKFIGKFNETFLNSSSNNNSAADGSSSSSSVGTGTGLSERAIKLREIMKEYEEQSKVSIDRDTELNVSSTFGQTFQLDVDPQLTDWKKFAEEFLSLLPAVGTDTVTIKRQKPIIKENINKLAGHVFVESAAADQQLVQFSSAFLDPTTQLPGNLKSFREEVMKSTPSTSTSATTTLEQYRFKINNFFTCAESELHTRAQLSQDFIKDEEIVEFFDKLVFAVDQPNEAELSEIIKAEIGEDFNLIDSDFAASYVQKIMLDWFKEKGRSKGAEGRFFTHEDGAQLFASTRQKVARLMLVSSKLEYEAKIEKLGVTFKAHVVEKLMLSDFLTSTSGAQILCITTEYPALSAIKLYQSLKHLNEYQKDDSYVFKRLSSLLRTRKHVLRAFKSKACNLLIIECARHYTIKDMEIKDILLLGLELCTVINSSDDKKIVLICKPTSDTLSDLLSTEIASNKYKTASDNRLSLRDLTDESQIQLLKRSKLLLHEREVASSDLIDESARGLVDSAMLNKFINGDVINLGNDVNTFSSAGYDIDYYIERTFNCHVEIKPSIFQKKKNVDLFAISGVNENMLNRLSVKSEKMCLFAEVEPNNFTRQVIILNDDDEKAREQFKELCRWFTSRNIHWLRSEKLIWQQSHGSICSLVHHKNMETSIRSTCTTVYSEENVLLREEEDGRKVVIISDTAGMGKSTVLVNFSKTIATLFSANDHRSFWVIRIDLNSYTSVLAKEVKAASFNVVDLESLIHFFLETLLESQEQSRVKSDFEKRLIAHSLRKPSSKIKLVLLFDGFDEISPDYKDAVLDLLLGLTRVSYVHKLFITTRPNFREVLEEKLRTFAYTLESFSETNQVDFLVKFWKKKLVFTEENDDKAVLEFAKLVVNKFSTAINDKDKEFTGIPLQLRMIAEVFQETPRNYDSTLSISWPGCKEFVEAYNNESDETRKLELPDKIDLLSLYEHFARKKFYDLHYGEKKNVDFTKTGMRSSFEKGYADFIQGHRILAAHSLLSPAHFNEISSKIERKRVLINWIENIKNGNENTGIIDKIINEKARFIHLTFAEYFVSFFFVQKLLFAESNFLTTIRCINSVIANLSPLFLNNIIKLLNTKKRKAKLSAALKGQMLVNVITEQGCFNFVEALLEAGYEDYSAADHLGRTPLHCAAIYSRPDIVYYLLKDNNDVEEAGNGFLKLRSSLKKEDSQLVKYVNKEDFFGNTAVYYAAKNGSVEINCDIFEYYTAQRVNEEMERDVAEYRAAKDFNMRIVGVLLCRGANIGALKNYLTPVIQYMTNELILVCTRVDDAKLQSIVERFLLQAPHAVLECVNKYLYPKLLFPFIKKGRVDVVSSLFSLLTDDDAGIKKYILNGKIFSFTPLDHVNLNDELNDQDRLSITKYLVENGGTETIHGVNFKNNYSKSNYVTNILEAAATRGHLQTFQAFIDRERDDYFYKHFYFAARYQHMNIIRYILENYSEKVKDGEGNGALHIAAEARASLKIVKYLLDSGENVNARNDNGESVLFTAIHANHKVKVIEFLVENGADVNLADKLSKTALHYAVEKDKLDIIKYLLSLVTLQSTEKRKFSSFLEIVESSPRYSSLFDDIDTQTPLNGIFEPDSRDGDANVKFKQVLNDAENNKIIWLTNEINNFFNSQDLMRDFKETLLVNRGVSPVTWKAYSLGFTDVLFEHNRILFILIARNANRRKYLLHVAAETNDFPAFQFLFQWNDDYNGQTGFSKLLLSRIVDYHAISVDAVDFQGNTPLHLVTSIVEKASIISTGIITNVRNLSGRTVLHEAAIYGSLKIVKWLVEHGANVYAEDFDGKTALHLVTVEADNDMYKEIIEYLKLCSVNRKKVTGIRKD